MLFFPIPETVYRGRGGAFTANDPMYNHSYYVNRSLLALCSAALEIWVLQQMAFDK